MLTVANLNQYYGGSHILRDVSFELPAGKVTAVLGRNGVGKTTLLRTLMGLIPAATGSVRFGDRDLTHARPDERARAGIGYVPQGREIFARLTVAENLEMGLATRERGEGVPARVFEMFPVLRQMMRRRGGDLSGGQQQQLAIGRALAMQPRLLILDEPTEGIQPSIIKDIERAIRTLAATGEMAILLVEQYYDFARSLADQYLVMERGEIVARGAGADMERDGVRARPVCHAIVVHPPAGIAGGDELVIDIALREGAGALLTTPGAAKWYRTAGPWAKSRVAIAAEAGSTVEWLPQGTILYDGALADIGWEARIAATTRLVAWDIVCLGRTGSGERFTKGRLRLDARLYRDGKLAWLERGRIEPESPLAASPAGLAGRSVAGTMIAAAPVIEDEWLALCRDVAPAEGEAAVTRLPGLLVAR